MIDFTSCPIIPSRVYNGANGNKIAVKYNDTIYMLKFPPSAKDKPTDLSYTNSCISEHLASNIFNMLGIRSQKTILGKYTVKGNAKIICACKDFTTGQKRLFDFCSIKNTILDSDSNGSGTELSDIMEAIEKQKYLPPLILTEHFWNVFIVDAFLGNFDRHNGNWGFLYDESNDTVEIAPVFDCGSCLLPQADQNIMQKVLSEEAELHSRVFQFPTSAIKIHGRKINYYDFIHSATNPDCNAALKRMFPKINLDDIRRFIDQVEAISDLQKEFYKTYIDARYNLILLSSYQLISSI